MNCDAAQRIKAAAQELGFEACGIAAVTSVDDEAVARYERWLDEGRNGCMDWAARHRELRNDPRELLEGARSIIVVALNYYPAERQAPDAPQVAFYAYGRDYHEVMRERLGQLATKVQEICGGTTRACVDSAPLRERYWAQQAGIGFIGRNNCLILPGKGSFFVLGELLTTAVLPPDEPCTQSCGDCMACVKACPGGALNDEGAVDASRCLSYLTIEHHGELPQWVSSVIDRRVVGCDACQLCCPHNAAARPTTIPDFAMTPAVRNLTPEVINAMTGNQFKRCFAHSAILRVRLAGLRRNLAAAHIFDENRAQ